LKVFRHELRMWGFLGSDQCWDVVAAMPCRTGAFAYISLYLFFQYAGQFIMMMS